MSTDQIAPLSLEEKIVNLPTDAGVYLMKDAKGRIIYVGKAKNLRSRVSSYFRGKDHSAKTRALVADICDFELMLTHTEIEALLLERTLIRHHAPRYNILLRDDKEYPYLRVDFNAPWPRLEKVRRRKDDGACYVGPFGNAGLFNYMLKTIYRIFPLIRCSPHEFKAAKRPCNYYHIKLCLGPCTLPVNRDDYVAMVRHAVQLLQGKNRELVKSLSKKMYEASTAENFELAASYRDQINALKAIGERQVAVVQSIQDADVIGTYEQGDQTVYHVLLVRGGKILGSENFLVRVPIDSPEDALESFLMQYYDSRQLPDELVLPFSLDRIESLLAVLRGDEKRPVKVVVRKSADYKDLFDIASRNAQHHFEQVESQKGRRRAELEVLKETLDLPVLPRRIECIDISNMQGTAIVASDVCFVDGKPAKEHYRRYTVKDVTGAPDDFKSMNEIVRRRLARGVEEDDLPDLLVIDGGKGQLNAAMAAKAEFPDAHVTIVSLAKSRLDRDQNDLRPGPLERSAERIFVPGEADPIPLEEGSPAFRIMTSIRDEAHRFAITFHRKKRSEISHASQLDEVRGIGPVLRNRLLKHFGGIEGIRNASLEELLTIKGMSENVAVALHGHLKGDLVS